MFRRTAFLAPVTKLGVLVQRLLADKPDQGDQDQSMGQSKGEIIDHGKKRSPEEQKPVPNRRELTRR